MRWEGVLRNNLSTTAFIERLEASAKKHKSFYIDINKCRRNILLHLKEMGVKIPVFTCMDEPKYFDPEKDTIETGFYFIESVQYFPLRHNGWYSHAMVNHCLEKKNNFQKRH